MNRNCPREFSVSIVIPVYNGANYLAQAIDSALAQTWPDCEVIVVDDGSDDNGATRTVIQGYAGRIRHVHKPNGGVGSALNRGLDEMRGAYFSWLSHDDLYAPTKVEAQIEAVRRHGRPCLAFSDFECFDEPGEPVFRGAIDGREHAAKPLWAVLEGKIHGCTMLVPRQAFEVCGRFDTSRPTTQDYELWFRMALRYPFVHVPDVLVHARQHAAQGSRVPEHLSEAAALWLEMLQRIPPETMVRYEGSERAFLTRAYGYLAASPYDSATEALASALAGTQPARSLRAPAPRGMQVLVSRLARLIGRRG